MAWQALSKYPSERAIAAARWKRFGHKIDPDIGIYAVCEVAFAGYHAYLLTEQVFRDRIAKLREVLAVEDKKRYRRDDSEAIAFLRSLA